MKSLLSVLLLALTTSAVHAQGLSNIPASHVDIGFGARPMAMGGAFVGLADDEHSVYWNPAGLADTKNYITSFSHADQMDFVTYRFMALAAPLPWDNLGAGITIIESGDDMLREFSAQLGVGYRWKSIRAGLGMKYRHSGFGKNGFDDSDYIVFDPDEILNGRDQQVRGNGTGFGVDLGLLYRPNDRVGFGVVYRDVMNTFQWDSENASTTNPARGSYSENLPSELILGSSFKAFRSTTVVADYKPALSSDIDPMLRMGMETGFMDVLFLRGGAEYRVNSFDDERYTAGVGIKTPSVAGLRLRLDYAYLIDPLKPSQRISIAIQF
jgi:hypothetical protein